MCGIGMSVGAFCSSEAVLLLDSALSLFLQQDERRIFITAVQVDKHRYSQPVLHTLFFNSLPLGVCKLCSLFLALVSDFFYCCFISDPEHPLRVKKKKVLSSSGKVGFD